jgi:translation initiation factor 2D
VNAPGHGGEALIPTGKSLDFIRLMRVYTLWQNPTILKTVSTWDIVLSKLEGGADLMTPGLTRWNSGIRKGDVVTITAQSGVPMAVGIAAHDIGKLVKAAGEKGKAVYLVHCYNDELWGLGSKTKPPTGIEKEESLEEATEDLTLAEDTEDHSQAEITEGTGNTPQTQAESEREPTMEVPLEAQIESTTEPSTAGTFVLLQSHDRNR